MPSPSVHVLTRLDTRPIDSNPNEIRLFSMVRDEVTRMPYFLKYYRQKGINRFFFIDNGSKDGTREYLLGQPDCHLFHTTNSFAEAVAGIAWSNTILDLYGIGHWCLIADADELLIYPHAEKADFHALTAFFDSEGSEALYTFMLDMYPKGSLAEAVCAGEKPFYEIASYFDKDYVRVKRIHLRGQRSFPPDEVLGGPRPRCFYPDQGEKSFARRLFIHFVDRGVYWLRKYGVPMPFIRLKSTPIFKMPLIKWKKGLRFTASTHITNQPVKLASISGVLLHFKFFSDFHARVLAAVKQGQHSDGSAEYRIYLKHMDKVGSLMYEGSQLYQSSDDVLKAGLMQTSEAYERHLAPGQGSVLKSAAGG